MPVPKEHGCERRTTMDYPQYDYCRTHGNPWPCTDKSPTNPTPLSTLLGELDALEAEWLRDMPSPALDMRWRAALVRAYRQLREGIEDLRSLLAHVLMCADSSDCEHCSEARAVLATEGDDHA